MLPRVAQPAARVETSGYTTLLPRVMAVTVPRLAEQAAAPTRPLLHGSMLDRHRPPTPGDSLYCTLYLPRIASQCSAAVLLHVFLAVLYPFVAPLEVHITVGACGMAVHPLEGSAPRPHAFAGLNFGATSGYICPSGKSMSSSQILISSCCRRHNSGNILNLISYSVA